MKFIKLLLLNSVLALIVAVLAANISYAQNNNQSPDQSTADKAAIDPDFQKMINESKQAETSPPPSLKEDVRQESSENTQTPVNDLKNSGYPKTTAEIVAFSGTIGLLLMLSFLGSSMAPKYRYLFIATPFDIGVREVKTDAQNAVKGKRIRIETFLLICCIGIYYYVAVSPKPYDDERIFQAVTFGAIIFALTYIAYIVLRLIFGFTSKCPKCKNMFAVSVINSYEEPKSTFQKRRNTGRQTDVKVIEVGVRHTDNLCSVCNHQWETTKSYQKQIDQHYE
jgi:hypothetical protein